MQVSELMPLMLVLAMCGMPQLLCWSGLLGETAKPKKDMPKSLPAISSLRYLAVLGIWFGHEYWHFVETSPFFAMLSGFVLQFAEERRGHDEMDNMGAKWRFFSRRFMRLYPIYALHVVTGSMAGLPWYPGHHSGCPAVQDLLFGNDTGLCDCGSGTWFIPKIIACYAMFPWVSQHLKRQDIKSLLLLLACTVLLVWGTQDETYDHMALAFVMARFFIGMMLVPIWLKISHYPGYRVFSALACNLGLCIVVLYASRTQSPLFLPLLFKIPLLLGVAGLCDNTAETTFMENPVLFCLSRPWLAWLGELALPLYMTNTLLTSFTDRSVFGWLNLRYNLQVSCLQHEGLNGKPWEWSNPDPGLLLKCPGQEVLLLVATEFLVIHAAAYMIYNSCAR